METHGVQDCLACCKHRGMLQVPDGAIFENEIVYVSHARLRGEEQGRYR